MFIRKADLIVLLDVHDDLQTLINSINRLVYKLDEDKFVDVKLPSIKSGKYSKKGVK